MQLRSNIKTRTGEFTYRNSNHIRTAPLLALVWAGLLGMSIACGETGNATGPAENTVIIERMFATSSSEPGNVVGLFGGGDWSSRASHAPLDGVMLYLQDAANWNAGGVLEPGVELTGIQVECSGPVQTYQMFINGNRFGDLSCGEYTALNNRVVSLYLGGEHTYSADPMQLRISDIQFYVAGESEPQRAPVLYPEPIEATLTASSTTEPSAAYDVAFLFDGRREFGWVEGAEGDGIGETVQIDLNRSLEISGLEIMNGYQRSAEHFRKNGTVRSLQIGAGERTIDVPLEDKMGTQRVFFDESLNTDSLTLRIETARSGSQWKDTAISELVLLGPGGKRYGIHSERNAHQAVALLEKIRNTSLASLVGNRMTTDNTCDGEQYSMVLRANGSFVIWKEVARADREASYVMDGNWLPLKLAADVSEIKIFGRLHAIESLSSVTEMQSPYGPGANSAQTTETDTIFSDVLRIQTEDAAAENGAAAQSCFDLIDAPEDYIISIEGNHVSGWFHY
ncbi:MAG: hypothetical protein KDK27_03415 [Leptospiraceae bacterium]|nr:hypothetical protein [Leptospiraceae bacterium]